MFLVLKELAIFLSKTENAEREARINVAEDEYSQHHECQGRKGRSWQLPVCCQEHLGKNLRLYLAQDGNLEVLGVGARTLATGRRASNTIAGNFYILL